MDRFIIPLLFCLALAAPAHAKELTTDCYEAVPGIDTNAYSDQEVVGGKLSFTQADAHKARAGYIKQLIIVDQDNEKAPMNFYLFCANPSAGTYTNQAALDIHDTDMLNLCCYGEVVANDFETVSDNAVAQVNLDCAYRLEAGQTLYGILELDGATPTYTAVTDLLVKVCVLEDAGQ